MTDARDLTTRFSQQTILVVGDVMLDHFVIGSVERISPEAPVPVVRFDREEYRLGGAANVAANLRALGARVEIVGLIGADDAGDRLRSALADIGVATSGLVVHPERCTTRKTRVVTSRNQQVARIDYEDDAEVDGSVAADLVDRIARLAAPATAILVSDYLKGAVSRATAGAAIEAAAHRAIPVTVDPKVAHAGYYRGATLVTPNHHEAEAITHMRARTDIEAAHCAERLADVMGCESVLITRGEHGMLLHSPDGTSTLPAQAREVSDVTGAGDTVIATLTLGLAAGASLAQAARIANTAAGIVVAKFGPATVSIEELLA
jgi:D-beta-D-heptose 7-phosphate kinase/D-beta-D-heptose 1-phosphate adenosyltransferase